MPKQTTELSEQRLSQAKLAQIKVASRLGSEAGKRNAIQRRKEYNANPNHCRNCLAPILVPLENMKRSLFQQTKSSGVLTVRRPIYKVQKQVRALSKVRPSVLKSATYENKSRMQC